MTQLSVILPVRDAESSLVARVEQLLDVLPELTSDFEILIVDNYSRDETSDLSESMSRRFPQVRWMRLNRPVDDSACLELGLDQARGEVVMVQQRSGPVRASQLRQLWRHRNNPQLLRPNLFRNKRQVAAPTPGTTRAFAQHIRELAPDG